MEVCCCGDRGINAEFFSEYGMPLTAVPSFKYLGHIIFSIDNDWPAVELNLRQVWLKWGRMVKILVREDVDKRMTGKLYVVVVQAVLLFGLETWVATPQL